MTGCLSTQIQQVQRRKTLSDNPKPSTTCFAYAEPSLSKAQVGQKFQFQRLGYFVVDSNTSSNIVPMAKTVGLRR